MRLKDARRLTVEQMLRAKRIFDENFSPRESRLDGGTFESALKTAGIEISTPLKEELLDRLTEGPLLKREELIELIERNVGNFLGEGWGELDLDKALGRMYAFQYPDTVFMKRFDQGVVLRPVKVEHLAGESLGRLLLSVEKIREVIEDEREAEKRLSPVQTEIEDEALYAPYMTGPLGAVESVRPVLASTDSQVQLIDLCSRLDVGLLDLSPEALEEMDLDLVVNLHPR